jgi:hypothetical protein
LFKGFFQVGTGISFSQARIEAGWPESGALGTERSGA